MTTETYEDYVIENETGRFAALLKVKSKEGRLPNALAGHYTSLTKAKQAIEEYKRTLKPKVSRVAENASN